MIWLVTLVLLFLFLFLISFLKNRSDERQGLPPGPIRFPLIGSIVQILMSDLHPFIAFEKLALYYGKVFCIQIGIVKMVVANGYEAVNQIYHNDDFILRPDDTWFLDRSYGQQIGLVGGSPDVWKETRRVCTRNLREYGFGIKNKMEYWIHEELEELCAHIFTNIEQTNGVFQTSGVFTNSVVNIVWAMVSGSRFPCGDRKLEELLKLIDDFMKSATFSAGPLTAYPFLAEYAPKLTGFQRQQESNRAMQKYMENILTGIRADGEYLTNPTNFIEVYLQKVDTRELDNSLDDTIYSQENLVSILYDFFVGSETASHILAYGILCLTLYPDVQKKVQQEIDSAIGDQRKPEISDKEQMAYTEAIILEIFRIATVAPMLPRKSIRDTNFRKYKIPKGTTVLLNLYSVAMDKEFWGDLENFRPERFLDSAGKIINADRILSFGTGKRNCIGESVAKSVIFVLFTGLLQKFNFALNSAERKPSLSLADRVLGFSLSPKPFSVIITPRE